MFEEPDSSMVKLAETVDPASICNSSRVVPKDQDELKAVRQQRIRWTRDEMLAIAPECKSLPDGLGVIPECLSSLFDVGEPTTVRARGKGRVGSSCDSGGRKRVEDSVRTAEQPTSVWRKKDRGAGETPERTERQAVKSRAAAEPAWRPRREAHDDGLWSTVSPNTAGAADGWLMPDADEEYELGGNSSNVEAFEVMRQQARAEWAQSQNFKPVQDSATEDLMKDLMADAENGSKGNPGAPPGLEVQPASRPGLPASKTSQKIDIQMLFNDIPPPPGLNRLTPDHGTAEKGIIVSVPPEKEMRSMLRTGPGLTSDDATGHESQPDADVHGHVQAPVKASDQVAERPSLVSSSHAGRGVDVGSLLNDGGADDALPGFSHEDMPMSQGMPRASSPPASSPRGSIWGPGLDAGAGSTITSTDWNQMQEIWNREPASKSLEAAAIQRLNDEFNNERLNGTSSTSMAGVTQAHALLSDSMVYGRHPDVLGGPAFTATQVPQARAAVSDSMAALASMSLLPVQKTGADKQLHQDKRQVQSMTGHGTQAQHDYNSANMMRRQQQAVQQRPPAHMQPQHRGAAEDPHSFELYLKQLVANAQQQQQVGEQRAQAAASSRTVHAPSVIQPRASSFNHANSATQQASLEHIRKLAPIHLANTAVPQQRQVSHMPTARQLQPQASSAYAQHPDGHKMQDPTWMLRQLKGSGHPQSHVAAASVGNLAMQQAWATPTRMQAPYPSSTYDRRGHHATMQQYGAAHTARVGLQQTNATLQGMYADQLARAALQSAARQPQQPQQQSGLWLPQATSQHHQNAYAAPVRPAHVQGLQQAMNRGGHYAVQSSVARYYPDNTQPGYTALYRE